MMKFLLLCCLLLPLSFVRAQSFTNSPAAGMGAYSQEATDIFCFSSNQASLAQLKNNAVGVGATRRFLLAELNDYNIAIGLLTHTGNIGFEWIYTGFSAYHQSRLALAYGRKLGNKMSVGAQFNYNTISIAGGYGHASAITAELGTIFHLSGKLHTGFHITNIIGDKMGKDQAEKLPMRYSFGIGYDASTKCLVTLQIEKEERQTININTGVQYRFLPILFIRIGMTTATSSIYMGAGLSIKKLQLIINTAYHPSLGISSGLQLLYHFNKPASD